MATKRGVRTIAAVVAGSGFEGRAAVIARFCKDGSPVQLRREPANPHDANAIGVWIECSAWFGLARKWRHIGYIKAERAERLAADIDDGSVRILGASVRSFHVPVEPYHPRVSLEIEAEYR